MNTSRLKHVHRPDLAEIPTLVAESRQLQQTIVLLARCAAEYRGRGGKDLDAGKRIIRLQPDGTITVDGEENMKPSIWQPAGSEYSVRVREDYPVIESSRTAAGGAREDVSIILSEVFLFAALRLTNDSDIPVMGSEEDVVEKILATPTIIHDEFRPIETEFQTGAGPVDIYGRLGDETDVLVEVKRAQVTPKNVMQLHRYMRAYNTDHPTVGFLAGAEISSRAKTVLDEEGFGFVQVRPDIEAGTTPTETPTLADFVSD